MLISRHTTEHGTCMHVPFTITGKEHCLLVSCTMIMIIITVITISVLSPEKGPLLPKILGQKVMCVVVLFYSGLERRAKRRQGYNVYKNNKEKIRTTSAYTHIQQKHDKIDIKISHTVGSLFPFITAKKAFKCCHPPPQAGSTPPPARLAKGAIYNLNHTS